LKFVDPAAKDRKKPAQSAPRPQVLIRVKDRAYFEQALKNAYREEGGENAEYTVVNISSKTKDDFEKLFKGSSYDTVVYDGHGSNIKKIILPEGKLGMLKPADFEEALKGAASKPKQMFFYGCSTAKSGFARELADLEPGMKVTGSGNRIAPYYTYGKQPTITEDRDHNITFEKGKDPVDVRKIEPNVPLPR
jgi:hypothetical protein